jgi:hypothetical protein
VRATGRTSTSTGTRQRWRVCSLPLRTTSRERTSRRRFASSGAHSASFRCGSSCFRSGARIGHGWGHATARVLKSESGSPVCPGIRQTTEHVPRHELRGRESRVQSPRGGRRAAAPFEGSGSDAVHDHSPADAWSSSIREAISTQAQTLAFARSDGERRRYPRLVGRGSPPAPWVCRRRPRGAQARGRPRCAPPAWPAAARRAGVIFAYVNG